MKPYQQNFMNLAMTKSVIKFGEFTLKSGPKSPYFFNIGAFDDGLALRVLGEAYAAAICEHGFEFDVLFGPAYKGIPLAVATAIALSELRDDAIIPYAFNRKEVKDHGEGGQLVGASIAGKRVLIIDDVITAGTAFREAQTIITAAGGEVSGLVTAINREERSNGEVSAMQELAQTFDIPTASIIALRDIIDFVGDEPGYADHLPALLAYREQYSVNS